MQHHHDEHLVVEVLVHKVFAFFHKLLVCDHFFCKVGKVLNGLWIVVPKIGLVVEVPLSVMMGAGRIERAGEHLFKLF